MRLIDADGLIEQIKMKAECEECDNRNGVKCRTCPWDKAMVLVDDYADNAEYYRWREHWQKSLKHDA